jgi:alpha-L-fucosidase
MTDAERMKSPGRVPPATRLEWFHDARFGMFIHWGLYAIPARGEWAMFQEKIPAEEYAPLAKRFRPRSFDADAWVGLAKEAGCKYIVLTTRHHEGFCLFDSKVSDFTAPKTAAGRDFIAEYVRACRRAGLKIGFYYSLLDWRFPAYYDGPEKDPEGWKRHVRYSHAQVCELCTQYGRIDLLWYDGAWVPWAEGEAKVNYAPKGDVWRAEELNAMARELQPHIVINNRAGTLEDYDTPEQHIKASEAGRAWES